MITNPKIGQRVKIQYARTGKRHLRGLRKFHGMTGDIVEVERYGPAVVEVLLDPASDMWKLLVPTANLVAIEGEVQ
jgi:hypothetical protein